MTANLPFVHPAQDPSMETTARARSHVQRTVRRRRTQRRAVGSAAFAAFMVIGVAGVVAFERSLDNDLSDLDATTDDVGSVGDREDVVPDTKWFDADLSEDGLRLTIMVGSAGPGDGPCDENFEYEVVETGDAVTVGFDEQPKRPLSENEACEDSLEPQTFEIVLGAPLGDRDVFDGVQPEPRRVHGRAELVEVTVLPGDGWTGGANFLGAEGNGWQQTFGKDGADWYFNVQQRPEADATTPEGTPTPVTVHGIEGLRYSGQMNNTMESIVWVEGGLSITVWGEMQGPPTFTHSDELLEIAEGVQLPADG